MAIWYRVHEIADADGKGIGFYKLGRHNSKLSELPLIFCDHMHPTVESAQACRYFGPQGNDVGHASKVRPPAFSDIPTFTRELGLHGPTSTSHGAVVVS